MRVYLVHEHYDVDHLKDVKAKMTTLGAPTIHAVFVERVDAWIALEGCHRLRAAYDLGITPKIVEIEYSGNVLIRDIIKDSDLDNDISIDDCIDNLNDTIFLEFNEEIIKWTE